MCGRSRSRIGQPSPYRARPRGGIKENIDRSRSTARVPFVGVQWSFFRNIFPDMKKSSHPPHLTIVEPGATGPNPSRTLGLHGQALWRKVTAEYAIDDCAGVEMLNSMLPGRGPRRGPFRPHCRGWRDRQDPERRQGTSGDQRQPGCARVCRADIAKIGLELGAVAPPFGPPSRVLSPCRRNEPPATAIARPLSSLMPPRSSYSRAWRRCLRPIAWATNFASMKCGSPRCSVYAQRIS